MTHWQKLGIGSLGSCLFLALGTLVWGPLSLWEVVFTSLLLGLMFRMILEGPAPKDKTLSILDKRGVLNTVLISEVIAVGLDVDPPDSETFIVNVNFRGIQSPVKFHFNDVDRAREYIQQLADEMAS